MSSDFTSQVQASAASSVITSVCMQSVVADLDSSFLCASLELDTIRRLLAYSQELAAAQPRMAFAASGPSKEAAAGAGWEACNGGRTPCLWHVSGLAGCCACWDALVAWVLYSSSLALLGVHAVAVPGLTCDSLKEDT